MRITRASMGVMSRRAHMRFCAALRPPARSIFLRLAHLYATTVHSRFLAMAVTACCRYATEQRGRVSEQRRRAGKQTDPEAPQPTGKPQVAECSNAKTWHAHILCQLAEKNR